MDAILFDFDGTLVDTEPLHEEALRRALEPFTVPVREAMTIGLSDEDAIARAADEAGRHLDRDQILQVFREKVRHYIHSVDPSGVTIYPGAVELLRACSERVPVGICTAAMRAEVYPLIDAMGIRACLRTIVCADDVEHKKPAPDAYLLGCANLAVPPVRALALEDSARGVRSAVDAGMVVVALGHTTEPERLAHAHAFMPSLSGVRFDDLEALFAALDGSR